MDELSNITCALKEGLKVKIGGAESSFNLWFGDLILTDLNESTATFSTPTKIRKNILLARYLQVIKETLEEIIGFPVEVEIFALDETGGGFNRPSYDNIPVSDENTEESLEKEKEISEILKSAGGDKKTLLDEYTFDNFIEGESNKFAKAACFAVANDPCYYNPLFIHGHSGLGKTHLLYAIMNHMKKNNPDLKIIYKKSETFINELIEAIGNGFTAGFKEKYRSADVLLIDDIQFLAGKESTQEEFFHTFSALYESEKQIILTSDRPPMEIKPLTDRLRTRFEGGLIADVQPPSFELRTAIIRKKSDAMGLSIAPELVDYMADRLHNNIRQIEGVLKKLYAIISLTGADVTKESIDNVISIVDPGNVPTDIMIERIITAVSKKYGVPVEDIKSKKKTDNIANARHVAIYIIKKLLNLSYPSIGQIFGRDHSTVISSMNKVELNIRTKNNYEAEIQSIIKEVKG
jgi:chromosomal replication initiator protein